MKSHELKCWPVQFAAMVEQKKTFEIRKNDRDFKVGDELHLVEFDPKCSGDTGRSLKYLVTYLVQGPEWDIPEGICVMGLSPKVIGPGNLIVKKETYEGHGWIRVPRHMEDASLSWEERHRRLLEHHERETTFLIEKVRELARAANALDRNPVPWFPRTGERVRVRQGEYEGVIGIILERNTDVEEALVLLHESEEHRWRAWRVQLNENRAVTIREDWLEPAL